MSVEQTLSKRSNNSCELCKSPTDLSVYHLPPNMLADANESALVCQVCLDQIEDPNKMDDNHWYCLSDSMWSEYLPVQVLAWRMLNRLKSNSWAGDLFEQLYLDDDALKWAKSGLKQDAVICKDSNGNLLSEGDSVTLIKDLDVKGANFTAKQGTLVKKIRLTDNPEHIEGRVNGSTIVLVAKYLKKV